MENRIPAVMENGNPALAENRIPAVYTPEMVYPSQELGNDSQKNVQEDPNIEATRDIQTGNFQRIMH